MKNILPFTKIIIGVITVFAASNSALGQQNNNALWQGQGIDTVKTNRVVVVNNSETVNGTVNADNIVVKGSAHIKGFTLIDSMLTVLQNITSNNVKVISLANNGIKLVTADATGTITPFAFGLANQVLFGNGVWGTLPAPLQTYWQQSGSNIYYNTGTVGIGTNNPSSLYKLDVIGDARISGTLLASHILISTRTQADTSTTAVAFIGTPQIPITSNIKLFVEGDAKINGGLTSTYAAIDSLHIINKIKVGNSIYIDGTLNNISTDPFSNYVFLEVQLLFSHRILLKFLMDGKGIIPC